MRIVGSHDEQLMLKLQCANHARCEYCALQPFCEAVSSTKQKVSTYTLNMTYQTDWIGDNDNVTSDSGYGTYYYTNKDSSNNSIYHGVKIEEFTRGNPLGLFQLEKIPTILIADLPENCSSELLQLERPRHLKYGGNEGVS